jgi:hypothetical protein
VANRECDPDLCFACDVRAAPPVQRAWSPGLTRTLLRTQAPVPPAEGQSEPPPGQRLCLNREIQLRERKVGARAYACTVLRCDAMRCDVIDAKRGRWMSSRLTH